TATTQPAASARWRRDPRFVKRGRDFPYRRWRNPPLVAGRKPCSVNVGRHRFKEPTGSARPCAPSADSRMITMQPNDVTTIPLGKAKVLLLIAGAVLFVAAGYWMFQLDPDWIRAQRRFNSPLLVHGVGIAAMLFFGV